MSETGFSLLDLSGLSEPATKLIETVASGAGVLYEPTRIRRKARAEADAAAILAQGNVEVREINLRTAERIANNELRRQRNIESIVTQAVEALPDEVSSEPVSEDWVAQFFDYSQDVSNEQMQTVWARILAGEVTRPDSFSLRTLHLVRHLRQKEATQFKTLCSLVFDGQIIFRSNSIDDYLRTRKLSTVELTNLVNIGLINTGLHYPLTFFEPGIPFSYFKQKYFIRSFREKNEKLRGLVNIILLTPEGRELASIVQAEANVEYIQLVREALSNQNLQFKLEV